jgi:glycerate dehydrogenase
MSIIYSARKPYPELAFPAQHVPLDTLFREADIVTLHCSLTEDNRGFINKALLATMKPSAFLVNTARGQLIQEQDLADALKAGVLAGAALDVLSGEPPSSDNPLLSAPGCLVTPHMAWASLAARRRIMQTTQENVQAFLSGKPINVVNP